MREQTTYFPSDEVLFRSVFDPAAKELRQNFGFTARESILCLSAFAGLCFVTQMIYDTGFGTLLSVIGLAIVIAVAFFVSGNDGSETDADYRREVGATRFRLYGVILMIFLSALSFYANCTSAAIGFVLMTGMLYFPGAKSS